jgi:hypothetical protein
LISSIEIWKAQLFINKYVNTSFSYPKF